MFTRRARPVLDIFYVLTTTHLAKCNPWQQGHSGQKGLCGRSSACFSVLAVRVQQSRGGSSTRSDGIMGPVSHTALRPKLI